jgi:transposase
VALARKIAVIAWALLRDGKDWEPSRMIEVTESFGPMNPRLKESLQTMTRKENSDQRKSRLRKEAREAKATAAAVADSTQSKHTEPKAKLVSPEPRSRRARKPVSLSDAQAPRPADIVVTNRPCSPFSKQSSRGQSVSVADCKQSS